MDQNLNITATLSGADSAASGLSGVDAILVKMEADLARIAATGDASLAALTQGHTTAAAAVRLG
jgi:hypothetical protein